MLLVRRVPQLWQGGIEGSMAAFAHKLDADPAPAPAAPEPPTPTPAQPPAPALAKRPGSGCHGCCLL